MAAKKRAGGRRGRVSRRSLSDPSFVPIANLRTTMAEARKIRTAAAAIGDTLIDFIGDAAVQRATRVLNGEE